MIGCKGIPASQALGGGIETHVEELSTRLALDGHLVSVYVRPYTNPAHEMKYKGVNLITITCIKTKNLETWTHTLFSTLHALVQPLDIIHYHGVGPSTLAWIVRVFKPKVKVIVTFHSRDQFHTKWGLIGRAYLALGEWTAVRFPHATIAVAHTIQLFCRKKFHANVWHIPNGVQIPISTAGYGALSAFHLEPEQYFYTLGRLVPHKSIEDAIHAYRKIVTTKKLVIIGEIQKNNKYAHELGRLAKRDPRVIMIDRQVGVIVQQLIANSYAMIHPSRSEGLSVAVLEAMSYGKMVIMSDIPENLELVDHSAVAYSVGDIDELAKIISWSLSDPALVRERGVRARDIVKKLYSWESVVERTEALYKSVKMR